MGDGGWGMGDGVGAGWEAYERGAWVGRVGREIAPQGGATRYRTLGYGVCIGAVVGGGWEPNLLVDTVRFRGVRYFASG